MTIYQICIHVNAHRHLQSMIWHLFFVGYKTNNGSGDTEPLRKTNRWFSQISVIVFIIFSQIISYKLNIF